MVHVGQFADPSQDLLFSGVEGNNVRKNNNILTLNYSEVEWLKQPFATRSESVTPFLDEFLARHY